MSETSIVKLQMDCPLVATEHLSNMSESDLMVIGNAFPDDTLDDDQRSRKAKTMVAQFAMYIDNSEKARDKLLACVTQSIAECMLTLASLDLPLTKSLGYAALIPYGGVCTVMLQYQGLGELMYRTGTVASIQTGVVYKGDKFDYELGSNPWLTYKEGDGKRTDENLTHSWCICHNKVGPQTIEVMNKAELDKVRKASKMPDGPAWKGWFSQMCRKAPEKRIAKYMQTAVGGMAQTTLARGLDLENSQYDVGRIEHYKGVRAEHSKSLMAKASESLGVKTLPSPSGDIPDEVAAIKLRMKDIFGNAECSRVARTIADDGIIRTLDEAQAFEKILNAGTAEDGESLPPEYQ
jgi:phage RecT family recombinase